MTEYLDYKDCFVRVAVTELTPGNFIWEYQVDGGEVHEDREWPLPSAVMAFKMGASAAKVHIDQATS